MNKSALAENRQNNPKRKGFRLLVIALAVIFAINLIVFIVRLSAVRRTYVYEYSDMSNSVENHDFADLAYEVVHNEANGVKPEKDTAEFAVLVSYYEKALLYRAYKKTGDTESAEALLSQLQSLEEEMSEPDVLDGAEYLKEIFILADTD